MSEHPASETPSRREPRGAPLMPKGRLEAFSDGVLAIVITIIVLELEVPERAAGDDLLTALAHEWRSFAAYLISFVFVGGVWITHANATRLIGRADPMLLRLNLVVLFTVSFLPFTTSVMATHVDGAGEDVAVALYGINLLIASLVLNAFIYYAARHAHLVSDEVADDELRAVERQRRTLIVVQAIATGIAIVLPELAIGAYLVISVGFILAPLVQARRSRHSTAI